MDRLRNDPKWVPVFLFRCSWKFPEQLRNKSEHVGPEEIHPVKQSTLNTLPVRLKFLESFLFTLPLISSET